MALPYLDGTVAYGSRQVTFSTAGAMVADSIELTRPTNVLERTNELGAPSGFVVVPGFVTGTATVQLPTGGTVPTLSETFTVNFGGGNELFVVTEVGQPESKDALKVVNVSFRKDVVA